MHYATRIAFNSANWHHPTGDAKNLEAATSFVRKFGFGHEDWLFRSEWIIDGWRYAFIQGVSKSHAKLVRESQSFDLTLFTFQPDRVRYLIATIKSIECLDERQAQDAMDEFKRCGWHGAMMREIAEVGGDPSGFGAAEWAPDILNVRFRLNNVMRFPPAYVWPGKDAHHWARYQLYNVENFDPSAQILSFDRTRSTSTPNTQPFLRSGTGLIECTPEHARIQVKLMEVLQAEYPGAQVEREYEFVDVRLDTGKELILFEIKSDLEPKAVIRQALGQILEYAYHPSRSHPLPVRLVIVGRGRLETEDQTYLNYLKSKFSLPLDYRRIEI